MNEETKKEEKKDFKKQKGGRKKLPQEEVRNKKISIHLTKLEYDAIKKYRSDQAVKKTLAEEIRIVYLAKVEQNIKEFNQPKEVKIREGLELTRREVFKIGVNLNQIAHRVNTYKEMMGNKIFFDDILKEIQENKLFLMIILKKIEEW